MPSSERFQNDTTTTSQLCFTDLPNEIIAKIFHAGTLMWSESWSTNKELPFPLVVSSLSGHLRLLAQNTPELWSFIVPPLHKNERFCISHTSEWLQRSGSLLVSVVLDVRRVPSYPRFNVALSGLLFLVFVHIAENAIHRIRRMDVFDDNIYTDNWPMLEVLPRLSGAVNLEQLGVYLSKFIAARTGINSPFWEWSLQLPNLRILRVEGLYFPYNPNITTLSVFHLRLAYQDVQTMFSSLPNLTTLVVKDILSISSPIPSDRTLIEVKSLRTIAVSCTGRHEDSQIYLFKLISVPNLTHLELDGAFAMSISVVFDASISDAKIETLRLSNCPNHPPYGGTVKDFEMFHSFTFLRHLQIVRAPVIAALFSKTTNPISRSRTRSIHLPKPPNMYGQPMPGMRLRGNDLGSNLHQGTAALANEAFDPMAQTNDLPWPDLRIISLDTLSAADVALLCTFVNRHDGVHTVELSKTTMRHLSQSLQRFGNQVNPKPWRARYDSDEGMKDVPEWLAERVHLTLLQPSTYGLLDKDKLTEF
ncbi:hypothetical protein BDN70DRAFT_874241 [Pholiota conissans]|uniref:F-box domain-containing protein n=1 Tax=Pholiota conissans TaxID=109636 RepID=A0A9P6CXJ8_9AGAR|nr:hypothetical protein BDN70DRAFT_874241 [Pholiota conissans]